MSTDSHSTPEPHNLQEKPRVLIYVDGACIPNPGSGGIGVLLIFGSNRKEISRHIGNSTNQQTEILAAIEGLNALKTPCAVEIISDSQYLIRTMNGEYGRKANLALWYTLDTAVGKHEVTWRWVKGHSGNPDNERADRLANAAALRRDKEGLF